MIDKDIARTVKYILMAVSKYKNLVTYSEIVKQLNIPLSKIQSAKYQICEWLMRVPIVDDVDICDEDSFDVMIKTIRV